VIKQLPVTRREWALFGVRWIAPVGLLLSLLCPDIQGTQLGLVLAVGLSAAITNLIVLLLFLNDHWLPWMTPTVVVVDALLALAAVLVGGVGLSWMGLIPIMVAGFYFGWMPGLATGVGIAAGVLVIEMARLYGTGTGDIEQLDLPVLILSLVALPAAGPLATLLSRDESEMEALMRQVRRRGRQAEEIARLATAYMQVVYDLTDVLGASQLDPKRVLRAAVSFGPEGLERVGVQPPLYGAVLLFDDVDDNGLETILRVVEASMSVPPSDHKVAVPGVGGAIAAALERAEPVLSHAPATDPELNLFESFRGCNTVACLPLRAGTAWYGVLLFGSAEEDAFIDLHVDMMQAIANQSAASLRAARIYGSLLEQRDRIVEVEKSARHQLASELHDGPTQGLAAVTMRLNYIRKLLDKKPERAIEEVYHIEDMARRTTKEIRHMLFELRPKALEQGLRAGLVQLAAKIKETYDQNVELVVSDGADQRLDAQSIQTLFSIAIETVNNARKHAKADCITIQLDIRDDMLVMEVCDDGIGFNVEEALATARGREGHLGLINLQERAAILEGTLHIDSAPGEGTRTTVAIPLEVVDHRRMEEERRRRAEAEAAAAKEAEQQQALSKEV
jgi:signal transduction histidine kinase